MGLIDYLLVKTLKVSPEQLYRHECAEVGALVGDMLPYTLAQQRSGRQHLLRCHS